MSGVIGKSLPRSGRRGERSAVLCAMPQITIGPVLLWGRNAAQCLFPCAYRPYRCQPGEKSVPA